MTKTLEIVKYCYFSAVLELLFKQWFVPINIIAIVMRLLHPAFITILKYHTRVVIVLEKAFRAK